MACKTLQAPCLLALFSVVGCTGRLDGANYTSFETSGVTQGGANGVAGSASVAAGSSDNGAGDTGSGGHDNSGVHGGNNLGGESGGGAAGISNGGSDVGGSSSDPIPSGGSSSAGGSESGGNASSGGANTGSGGSQGDAGSTSVPSCQDACPIEGETSCNGNSVVVCKRLANGCLALQTQEACSSDKSCNLGACTPISTCTDECTAGSTLCNGTITCTNNDSDPCLEWSAPPVCPTPPPPTGPCKRGVAANVAPNSSFAKGLAWWYNWASGTNSSTGSIEFAPMIHDSSNVNDTIPSGSKYVLGFNEPNRQDQANLTAAQASALWPQIQAIAATRGAKIVSTAMSYCGSAQNPAGCNEVSPYDYLTNFFADCPGCKVDYIAVHWYNCDVPSLKSYIEGFYKFGKPIWLTEFACAIGSDTSAAAQQTYMTAAVDYLENNANVFRYSWFSADPIPQAKLINADGSPTALGNVYINLPNNCQ